MVWYEMGVTLRHFQVFMAEHLRNRELSLTLQGQPGSKGVAKRMERGELPSVGHSFVKAETVNDLPEGLRYPPDQLARPVLEDKLVGRFRFVLKQHGASFFGHIGFPALLILRVGYRYEIVVKVEVLSLQAENLSRPGARSGD